MMSSHALASAFAAATAAATAPRQSSKRKHESAGTVRLTGDAIGDWQSMGERELWIKYVDSTPEACAFIDSVVADIPGMRIWYGDGASRRFYVIVPGNLIANRKTYAEINVRLLHMAAPGVPWATIPALCRPDLLEALIKFAIGYRWQEARVRESIQCADEQRVFKRDHAHAEYPANPYRTRLASVPSDEHHVRRYREFHRDVVVAYKDGLFGKLIRHFATLEDIDSAGSVERVMLADICELDAVYFKLITSPKE